MTFSRLDAMQEYWESHPPLHVMVAAYLQIKPEPKKSTKTEHTVNTEEDLEEFIQLFTASGGRMG